MARRRAGDIIEPELQPFIRHCEGEFEDENRLVVGPHDPRDTDPTDDELALEARRCRVDVTPDGVRYDLYHLNTHIESLIQLPAGWLLRSSRLDYSRTMAVVELGDVEAEEWLVEHSPTQWHDEPAEEPIDLHEVEPFPLAVEIVENARHGGPNVIVTGVPTRVQPAVVEMLRRLVEAGGDPVPSSQIGAELRELRRLRTDVPLAESWARALICSTSGRLSTWRVARLPRLAISPA